ncbi:hypothetical protein BP5796_04659 [Coleophoma crateriformis]|uniref:Uncharacterized protein n=1 Tax=Coleophoma crateriformis TaxID=565419 RepID=A0A3D8SBN1_9HELO|nr:hypothetical protein BP5796_04659 [Coleophoma crateriformis]
MTTVENLSHASLPSPTVHVPKVEDNNSVYDSDDGQLRDSPLLKPMRPNLEPSPSPPPAVSQVSPDSSPGRKASNRSKVRPSQSDAVLVAFMDGGKHPEIAIGAGMEPLPSDDDSPEGSVKAIEVIFRRSPDLTALAAGALAHVDRHAQDKSVAPAPAAAAGGGGGEGGGNKTSTIPSGDSRLGASPHLDGDAMDGVVKPRIPPMSTGSSYAPTMRRAPTSSDTPSKVETSPSNVAGELPPIQALSPQSGPHGIGAVPITLPGLRDQLGDLNQLGEAISSTEPSFSQSPQVRPPPRFSTSLTGQATSPTPLSPTDFRRDLPSPSHNVSSYYAPSNYRKPSQSDGGPGYVSNADYSSSNTETPSTDQSASTPALGIDRMSIDGITNPQIGGFQCTYVGCTAQPFQTQVRRN